MFGWLIASYTQAKSGWSRAIDYIWRKEPRRPVPLFASPKDAAGYLMARAKYTGNPLNGAADFYTNPERIQWAMETGDFTQLYIDCDSFAAWAYVALRKIPGCAPQIYTLLDAGLVGSHVVCAFTWNGLRGVVDTNGYRELSDVSPQAICVEFTRVYAQRGYRYIQAVATDCPW